MTPDQRAETFARVRTEAELTQAEVAEAFGVAARSVRRWEAGSPPPLPRDLMALCALVGRGWPPRLRPVAAS